MDIFTSRLLEFKFHARVLKIKLSITFIEFV